MLEIELKRTRGERRSYALEGVGTMRVGGIVARTATASDLSGRSWLFRRRGRSAEARDELGSLVGEFRPNRLGRGGALRWEEREVALEATCNIWQERYRLVEARRELGLCRGRSWGRSPVRFQLVDDAELDAGLLLFVAFVVRGLTEYATQ
jgi:hypothetical protein